MSESSGPNRLSSSVEGRLWQLRGDLVLQLFMRRGPLWEAVREVRDRWNISPKVQLPPAVMSPPLPDDAPGLRDDRYTAYVARWHYELDKIRTKVDPKRYLTVRDFLGDGRAESWYEFLGACVLYDPPEDRLIEYASYGSQEPTYLADDRISEGALRELPEMVDPPIKSLWELMQMGDWFWERVLKHIDERYLKPGGMDAETLLQMILQEVPGLREEHKQKQERYSSRYYIKVDEYTTQDDVKNAFTMIRKIQPNKGATTSPRGRLKAVQGAILYDRHNERLSEYKRLRRWTYKKLAEHLDLKSARAAKEHVRIGREILNEEEPENI